MSNEPPIVSGELPRAKPAIGQWFESLLARALGGVIDIDVRKFGALLVQVVGLACIVGRYRLESDAFFDLFVLATVGFAIQYFLPLAYRGAFFLLISLVGIVAILGMAPGVWLIAIGIGLLVLVHLPVPMAVRVGLLCVAGATLAFLRTSWVPVPWSAAVWPILGSIFMFRLIVYVYDLKYGQAPESWDQRLSYFFMLPNVCFPLFPVVDSRAYARSWYEGDRHECHQVGVEWILRGLVQLLLYRLIYLKWAIDPYDVANLADVIHYCLWLFLLYLRVSGQFHVIVGMLRLFGFNLPETHHHYYLASSFTDFWRRINIYWKDFMMKIFYYPTYFRMRKHPTIALILSTAYVFAWTWVLHAYQLFWIRGSYSFTWNDPLFWTILCVLVTINALWEAKFGRRRTLAAQSPSWSDRAKLALKTFATFAVICVLWSFWSSESPEFWFSLLPAARVMPEQDQSVRFALGTAAVVAGLALFLAWNRWGAPLINRRFEWRVGLVVAQLLLLNAISISSVYERFGAAGELVAAARFGGLNQTEMGQLERGYYEDLLTVDRFNGELASLYARRPVEWGRSLEQLGLAQPAEGIAYQLKPGSEAVFKGATLKTNRWGMHDKEYAEQKPSGTYRIAVLGASHTMGTGVPADQTMEAVFEERLNDPKHSRPDKTFEVLNFAVYGYNPIEQIHMIKGLPVTMQCDAVFYVGHPGDIGRVVHYLLDELRMGRSSPYPRLREIVAGAGVDETTPGRLAHRQLTPYGERILEWVYDELVTECRAHDMRPVFVLLPMALESREDEPVPREVELAANAGFSVLNLQGVYQGHQQSSLWIADWDAHPNALGHRLIGERLFELFQTLPQLVSN